jgi:hypothetical protein
LTQNTTTPKNHVVTAEEIKTAVSSIFKHPTTVGIQIAIDFRPVIRIMSGGNVCYNCPEFSEILGVQNY